MENYMIRKIENPMIQKMGNYMIPQIKVRLNLHINSTLMSHQMVFIFCAHIGKLYDPKNGKLYDLKMGNYMFFQLKVRLNIRIS